MKFSKEELSRANENGSLESLLLGHGILPMDILKQVLTEENKEYEEDISYLKSKIEKLEYCLDDCTY